MPTRPENKESPVPHLAIIIEDDSQLALSWKMILQSPGAEVITSPTEIVKLEEFLSNMPSADLSRTQVVLLDKSFARKVKPDIINFLTRLKKANPKAFVFERSGAYINEPFANSDAVNNLVDHDQNNLVRILIEQPSLYLKMLKLKTYLNPATLFSQRMDPHGEWCRVLGRAPDQQDVERSMRALANQTGFEAIATHLNYKPNKLKIIILHAEKAIQLDLLHSYWNAIEMLTLNPASKEVYNSMAVRRIKDLLKTLE